MFIQCMFELFKNQDMLNHYRQNSTANVIAAALFKNNWKKEDRWSKLCFSRGLVNHTWSNIIFINFSFPQKTGQELLCLSQTNSASASIWECFIPQKCLDHSVLSIVKYMIAVQFPLIVNRENDSAGYLKQDFALDLNQYPACWKCSETILVSEVWKPEHKLAFSAHH